jgi:hypothetical protein
MRFKIPKTKLYLSLLHNLKESMALICVNHKSKPRWCLHIFVYKSSHWGFGYKQDDDEWTYQTNLFCGPLFFFCTWRAKD